MSNIFNKVKEEINILEAIEKYTNIDLTEISQDNPMCLCPFHDEKTASFKIYLGTNSFFCFGCEKGGSVIDLVVFSRGVDSLEAARTLATDFKIEVEPLTEEQKKKFEVRAQRLSEMDIYIDWAHKNLTKGHRDILNRRGVPDRWIDKLKIGFDPRPRKFEIVMLGDLNLMSRTGDYLPSQRIVIPTYRFNRPEFLIFWNPSGEKPKYLYPTDEGKPLIGSDILLRENSVFIVEGIFDYLSMLISGYPTVCLLGKNITDFQSNILSNTKRIYILFDGDQRGREGAQQVAHKYFPKARIVTLPDEKDPNDLASDQLLTMEGFKQAIDSAVSTSIDFLELRIEELKKQQKWDYQQFITDNIIPLTSRLDETTRHIWFEKNKAELSISLSIFRSMHSNDSCDDESEKRKEVSANFDGLVDLVDSDGRASFIVKQDGQYSICGYFETEEMIYVSPDKDSLPWDTLPGAENVLKHIESTKSSSTSDVDEALFDKIVFHHKEISELQKEEHYWLIAAWVMLTYLTESIEYFPILCFAGTHDRGKSRTGKGITYIAFRGIHVDTFRESNIIRQASDLRAALFIDVMNLWKSAEKSGCEDLLLSRFEKGIKVARVLHPDRGPINDTVYYDIFGPTIIATNTDVHKILESRALSLQMPITEKIFDDDVKPKLFLPLKEELIAFRGRHLNETLPETPKLVNGRLGDIFRPLHQIIKLVKPSIEVEFAKLIYDFEKERKEEISLSYEGQIVSTVISLEDQVEKGRLPNATILDKFNESRPDNHKITSQSFGRKLTSIGFQKGKTNSGCAAIIWDSVKIETLKLRYGLTGVTGVSGGLKNREAPDAFTVEDKDGRKHDLRDLLRRPDMH